MTESLAKKVNWGVAAVFAVTLRPSYFPFMDEGRLGGGHWMALANRLLWAIVVLSIAAILHRLVHSMRSRSPERWAPTGVWITVWVSLALKTLVDFLFAGRPVPMDYASMLAAEVSWNPIILAVSVLLFPVARSARVWLARRIVLDPGDVAFREQPEARMSTNS